MSGTILLADDSLTIQKVVELTFADTDYRVVAVSSGDELLQRMAAVSPDLIICDVIMPGKDGYDVCQEIKSSSDWLHLPVILLTGTFEPFDRDRAIAAGCSEIITKPFEAQKLVDTVERLIGSAQPAAPPADAASSFLADDEEWPDEATPVDVPHGLGPAPEPEGFGTQLNPPAGDDDGIEFTTSGFAEMEAAGRAPRHPDGSEFEDGLDYDPTDLGAGAPSGSAPETPDISDPVSPVEDVNAQTMKIDMSHYAAEQPEDEPEATGPGSDARAPVEAVAEPFADIDQEPFESAAEPPSDDTAAPAFSDEPSMADTSPVEPPDETPEPSAETPTPGSFELSDDDVDRIARRVIEVASHRLDEIAWEIVPDMAEIVVRQRIRELEAEADAPTTDAIQ